MIDTTTTTGARAAERLRDEIVAWLTTVNPDGRPQSSPIWFLWTGEEILIYSLATTPRVPNIRANPHVSFHLDSDGLGGDVVSIEGDAHVDPSAPPASGVPAYIEKYRDQLAEYGWSPEKFSADYPVAIRIRPTRIRTW